VVRNAEQQAQVQCRAAEAFAVDGGSTNGTVTIVQRFTLDDVRMDRQQQTAGQPVALIAGQINAVSDEVQCQINAASDEYSVRSMQCRVTAVSSAGSACAAADRPARSVLP
jgi:glycosyltransferase involved in cell wall biosynthesis